MTAEVAIMNSQGIALAADSAVTLGIGKVYNTADKLFALSKYHPVGIMMYNSADIMGISCENIIKNYRDFLGEKSFDTLSEYAGDFINYLSKFPYFTEERTHNYLEQVSYDVFSRVLSCFLDDLHEEFDEKEDIQLSQIKTLFDATLQNIKKRMEKVEDEKQLRIDTDFIDGNLERISKMIEIVFEKFPISKKQSADLLAILKLNFRKCGWMESYTGIVIAGYGEREIFPTVHDFCVGGKIGNSLIYFNEDISGIDGMRHTASINPYAQTEMVHQFAKGIDPDFAEGITKKIDLALDAVSELLRDEDKPKMEAVSGVISKYIEDTIDNVYKEPIMDIVGSMQKSELVAMAEAMVNLTALKRHVSTDSETVGGPVDVALITKGDGFIWIKKKTNYDPSLNCNLHQNYFRGGKNGKL